MVGEKCVDERGKRCSSLMPTRLGRQFSFHNLSFPVPQSTPKANKKNTSKAVSRCISLIAFDVILSSIIRRKMKTTVAVLSVGSIFGMSHGVQWGGLKCTNLVLEKLCGRVTSRLVEKFCESHWRWLCKHN